MEKVSDKIKNLMTGEDFGAVTYQIEDNLISLGYRQDQIDLGIGYLRGTNVLKILKVVVINGRRQHAFYI
ncbi:hypothetical protein LL037_21160 [Clostridium estertheticum]|uniref:hypothetical protein n=1 Tax=Clostridium estertheticum TaxID=238834 RepID=UPI001C0BA834|nr:hypothetical protein [Clostridium estertheticum]MBU3198254.1 hypothetical protein [Clostridium estertheticum]MCB2354391.1 hypothetical protein [Clostridium estertheticum]WAG42492.1 hypothetical protein LL065_07400 [Clostridium estertheticum]WAG64945.1 hypothetical protein LL037_21160 [Clostridium estertheticum]